MAGVRGRRAAGVRGRRAAGVRGRQAAGVRGRRAAGLCARLTLRVASTSAAGASSAAGPVERRREQAAWAVGVCD